MISGRREGRDVGSAFMTPEREGFVSFLQNVTGEAFVGWSRCGGFSLPVRCRGGYGTGVVYSTKLSTDRRRSSVDVGKGGILEGLTRPEDSHEWGKRKKGTCTRMSRLVVRLPLRSSVVARRGGRWVGQEGASRFSVARRRRTWLLGVKLFHEVGLEGSPLVVDLGVWREGHRLSVHWSLLFDSLTVVRLVVVSGVSRLVHLYSRAYRSEDPHRARFRSYLSLFTFFRRVLVTAGNLVQRFVGWEGVGLCSYLLINFWFTRIQANKAAIKARLVNRVGDVGLRLGRLVAYRTFGTFDYATRFARAPRATGERRSFLGREVPARTILGLLLFVGAVGKSAQLGLHTWLPDAREGPTPVSALIHAATRVTAGVFLLARCSPILEYAPGALGVVARLGAATAFFAGTVGLVQNDLKRVIAYSTCSQLGYRVFACGLSAYGVAVFHLANHAVFKALLFLGAGSVIHARADEQDRRRRGGLVRLLPVTYAGRFIGSVALRGLPFLAGFYSKDVILEVAYASFSVPGHRAYALGTGAAFCTAFYSRRLLYLTFLGEPRGPRRVREGVHEAPIPRLVPLVVLGVGSVFVGWRRKDRLIGVGTPFWGQALFTHPGRLTRLDGEFLPTGVKLLPVLCSRRGGGRAVAAYARGANRLYGLKRSPVGREVYRFVNRKWRWDKVINEWVAAPALFTGYERTYKGLDRGRFELLGPHGLTQGLPRGAAAVGERQSGHLYHYGLLRLSGVGVGLRLVGLGGEGRQRRDLRVRAILVGSLGYWSLAHLARPPRA